MTKKHTKQVTARFLKAMRQIIADELEGVTTKSQFAERVGEHQQNISRMVKGERYPTIDVLVNICLIFKVDPAWLLLNKGTMFPSLQSMMDSGLFQRMAEIEKMLNIPKPATKKKAS